MSIKDLLLRSDRFLEMMVRLFRDEDRQAETRRIEAEHRRRLRSRRGA